MVQSSHRSSRYHTLRNWGALLPAFLMIAEDIDRSFTMRVPLPADGAARAALVAPLATSPRWAADVAAAPSFHPDVNAPDPLVDTDESSAVRAGACTPESPKEPLRGRIDRAVVKAARGELRLLWTLPNGTGRTQTINGRTYLFCLEPHYHEPGQGVYPEGWHKGVTVYFAAADQPAAREDLAHSSI